MIGDALPNRWCFNCNRHGRVYITGYYEWEGKQYPITLCQWCRGWDARRHNKAVKLDRAKWVGPIACDSPDYVTPPES